MEAVEQDVVIVGAGPAGSALAIELSDIGLKTLLVDKEKFPRDKPCGDYVSPKGLQRLSELGLQEEINGLGSQSITSSKFYLNHELLLDYELSGSRDLPNFGLALPRQQLDTILFNRASKSGVKSFEGLRVTGLEYYKNGVRLFGNLENRKVQITTRLLVGADGANSVIAKHAELSHRDPRYILPSVRAYAHGLNLPHSLVFFDKRFFPGYGWIFPIKEGLCNIGVAMLKEPIVRDGVSLMRFYREFRLLVQRLANSRGETVEFEPHQGFPVKCYGGARRNYFERGLLIGEAAGFVNPINTNGISLALDSAKLAAPSIQRCFETGDFTATGLSPYEKSWRDSFDPDLGVSDLAISLLRNRSMQGLWLSLLRTMSLTARQDKEYAAIAGGILGGVVPARKAITPEMIVRALVHPPAFWQEVYKIDNAFDWAFWIARGKQLMNWQANISKQIVKDDGWTQDWLKEITSKQASVVANQVMVNQHG